MKSYPTLPQGYVPFASIDLLRNKKQFWIVNGLSIALCVLMLIPPFLWGYSLFFGGDGSLSASFLRMGAALVGLLAYIALHEPDPRHRHDGVRRPCPLRL